MKRAETLLTDYQLVQKLLDGREERDGILFLYKMHFKSLTLFVMQNNGSEDDAKDIFQEVIVAFIHLLKENKFRGESTIKTFLFSLTRNIWYNELKRRGRAAVREINYEQDKQTWELSIEKMVETREAERELVAIMDQLGENCKKILLLFYYEGYAIKDMLELLDYENEQVVRNKKYKCLKKLTEMIEEKKGLSHQLKYLLHG